MTQASERGSVTAEFAVVVSAVVLVIALTAGVLAAAGRQVRLEQGAAQAARLMARGEPSSRAAEVVTAIAGGSTVTVDTVGDLLCVSVAAPLALALPLPDLSARSCALAGGR